MKKDWSVFRITVLLYIIVVLLPVNYYFANRSFESMKNDSKTMQNLAYINGAIQRVVTVELAEKKQLIIEVEELLSRVDQDFLQSGTNREFVEIFRAEESFLGVIASWNALQVSMTQERLVASHVKTCWNEVNRFTKTAQKMMAYKSETMLDKLYLSLLFSMLAILILISAVRLFIRLQLQKHAIHDHVSGLYNKKYYNEVLQKSKLLAVRQERPLALVVLSFEDYENMSNAMKTKEFEAFIASFSEHFRNFFRQSDTVCRIENNLFVAITPDADSENMKRLVLRLEKYLQAHSSDIKVEVRIGIANYNKEQPALLLEEATRAMQTSPLVSLGKD